MLKVWGRPNSINVQKVMWTTGELGLEIEHTLAGGEYGLNDQDWYLAMNPNGRVPVIDDDGFVLYESNAIVCYLSAKHGAGGLEPDSGEDRALAQQWMDWQQTTVSPAMFGAFWGLIRTPEAERDLGAIEQSGKDCAALFQQLDTHLEGRQYMVGGRLTIADIAIGAAAYRWFGLDVPHPDVPNLSAYFERLKSRAAYQRHIMIPIT